MARLLSQDAGLISDEGLTNASDEDEEEVREVPPSGLATLSIVAGRKRKAAALAACTAVQTDQEGTVGPTNVQDNRSVFLDTWWEGGGTSRGWGGGRSR